MNKIQLLARLKALEEQVKYCMSDLKGVVKRENGHEFYQLGIEHTGKRAIEHFDQTKKIILRILELANEPKPDKDL